MCPDISPAVRFFPFSPHTGGGLHFYMVSEVIDEKQMERYLLGLLPEDKASWLEERGLADYDFFERLLVVENRLIDDYLAAQLSPPDRAQFEKHFLSSPKRRERVEFARTFLRSMSQLSAAAAPVPKAIAASEARVATEGTSWPERLRSFFGFNSAGFGLAAAAAMLLAVFAVWPFLETRRVREELAQLKRERAELQQREQGLQARLDSQQGQTEELRKELERDRAELERLKAEEARLQQSSFTAIASIILRPQGLRGSSPGQSPQLTISSNTSLARLTLVVDEELIGALLESHPNVRAELSSGGKIQWSQEGLKPRSVKAGKAFVVTLPAERLSAGSYRMRLAGSGPSGETGIADYDFKVEKK